MAQSPIANTSLSPTRSRTRIKQEETIAIGDNFNELSMILAAGLGVGVQNTAKDMKPLCAVLTKATNEEGAVAEVIEKYILEPAASVR